MKTFLLGLLLCTSLFSFKTPPIKAPFMMVFIDHTNTSMGKPNGVIQVSVSGGEAPYQMLVVSVPQADTKVFLTGEKLDASGLKAGTYQVHIRDQKNLTYFNEVVIE